MHSVTQYEVDRQIFMLAQQSAELATEAETKRHRNTHSHPTDRTIPAPSNRMMQALCRIQNSLCCRYQVAPFFGERDGMGAAVNKADTEFLLQRGNLP
jgi:hypothetical protein